MNVILFGATGMVGSAALIECLDHPDVTRVLAIGRRSCGVSHGKLDELIHTDFLDYSGVQDRLTGYDACLFCLGVSSAGMSEEEYTRITYDFTMAAARALSALNPGLTFCYLSGQGADGSETGRIMWARVRGRLENHLLALEDCTAWIFRPGFIQPVKGVRSATRLYAVAYALAGPLFPILDRLVPKAVTTSERVGLALIRVARQGAPKTRLENADINELAAAEREESAGRG